MSEDNEQPEQDAPGPTGDGIEQAPRGNPDVDQDAIEKGEDTLERVKPY